MICNLFVLETCWCFVRPNKARILGIIAILTASFIYISLFVTRSLEPQLLSDISLVNNCPPLLHVCVGRSGFGDRILQYFGAAALGDLLNIPVYTFWRDHDTLSYWGHEHGSSDSCDAKPPSAYRLPNHVQTLSWESVKKGTNIDSILHFVSSRELNQTSGKQIRAQMGQDLVPNEQFGMWKEFLCHSNSTSNCHGKICGFSYEQYLDSWFRVTQNFELFSNGADILSLHKPFIGIHLRRGDKMLYSEKSFDTGHF